MAIDMSTVLPTVVSNASVATAQTVLNSAATAANNANANTSASDAPAAAESGALQAAAQQLQSYLSGPTDPPAFSVDYLSGLQVMTVRAASTGQVVFQIPNAEALRLAQLLSDGSPVDSVGLVNASA